MTDNYMKEMLFYNISTYELVADLLFNMESVKENICQNVSFHNNIVSASNNEILKQLEFSYSTDTEFNNLLHNTHNNIELSVFHINIRSLNKHHGGFESSVTVD